MAVAQVVQFRVTPGKAVEFNAQVAEAKKIQERLGGHVRVWQATAAGPNTGLVSYVIEHKDLADFAAFSDKLTADATWQAFVVKAFVANPTGTLLSVALANEMSL
jgi:hypothetical protein